MNRLSLTIALLVAASAAAEPPKAPASAAPKALSSAAPASASVPASLRALPKRKIRGPIKLYGSNGKLHPAMSGGSNRVRLTPNMLQSAMKLRGHGHADPAAPGGFRRFGKYWVRTPRAIDPSRATVSEWMRLVRGSLRSAQPLTVKPQMGQPTTATPSVASPASAGQP